LGDFTDKNTTADDYDYDDDNGDYATLSARIEELEEENKLLDEMLSFS
jgi:hypothetical protein